LDGRRWSTVGASTNIIEASWQAVSDGIEYGLLRYRRAEETPMERGSPEQAPAGR
ncbi:MAG: alpha-isopropylmalate synthase regulatory domain-containing protein, partial [Spirochaetaceae bacterium]